MKKQFSKTWRASKRPGKQRKYAAKAPLHIKKNFMNTNLSKELRKKIGKRSLAVRKGDNIKVMRGKFKGKNGKVANVNLKRLRVEVEGIQIKKQDGSKANVPLRASALQIIELNIEDKRRIVKLENKQEKKNAP